MALDVEGVVGGGMHRDEALGGSRRLEALHLAFSSAERLVGDLGPVVLVNPLFMVGAQADLLERSPVERSLSVVTRVGAKPCFLSSLRMSFGLRPCSVGSGSGPPAPRPHHRPPATGTSAAVDPHHHLIEMPARAGLAPQLPQVPRDRRPELADPAPDRLVGDIQSALRQQLLNVPVAQREPEIKPHGMLDDGGWELVAGIRDRLHPGRLSSSLAERHRSRDNASERGLG